MPQRQDPSPFNLLIAMVLQLGKNGVARSPALTTHRFKVLLTAGRYYIQLPAKKNYLQCCASEMYFYWFKEKKSIITEFFSQRLATNWYFLWTKIH